MVDGDRRDPTEVIDPGRQQAGGVFDEVWWGLQVDLRRQDVSSHPDCPEQFGDGRRRVISHQGARLREEVLDDHLLDVPKAIMRLGDGDQRLDPIHPALTDTDQQTGGEGDLKLPGCLEGGEPTLRCLVRGEAMGVEIAAEALEHHPLARRHRPQGRLARCGAGPASAGNGSRHRLPLRAAETCAP